MRVGRAAADAFDAGIIGERIAVHAEETAARGGLRFKALGARIAAFEVDVSVGDAEHADVTFAIERNVALHGRILPVGADTIECAVDTERNVTLDVAIADVAFSAEDARAAEPARTDETHSCRMC